MLKLSRTPLSEALTLSTKAWPTRAPAREQGAQTSQRSGAERISAMHCAGHLELLRKCASGEDAPQLQVLTAPCLDFSRSCYVQSLTNL